MEGNYPILLGGEEAGGLDIRREGLMTVFEARCRDGGELIRLSVYGESEGYLGVMLPEDGELRLTRRLSRQALSGFPQNPVFAGPAGFGEAIGPPERELEEGGRDPVSGPEPEPAPEPQTPPPEPEPELEPVPLPEDIVWRRGRFAVLRAGEPEDELIALPLNDDAEIAPGLAREIEGERYVVLRARGGKIV